MRFLGFLLLTVAATASAQTIPGQRPHVTVTTTYQSCTKSTMLACGRIAPGGGTYGTAHEYEHCTSIVLYPDGTFRSSATAPGTYRIFAGTVRFETRDGALTRTFQKPISVDGATLDGMKRLPR